MVTSTLLVVVHLRKTIHEKWCPWGQWAIINPLYFLTVRDSEKTTSNVILAQKVTSMVEIFGSFGQWLKVKHNI